ncbi:MAG: Na+/H+ antiporter subunit E [Sedimenticola sp.]|nr:Na+/H+ antiporter subunit E [Sedimenticola sp.]
MSHLLLLIIGLSAFWVLLSGFWDNLLLLSLGVASVLLVALLDWRSTSSNPEPYRLAVLHRLPLYWSWLLVAIVSSNIDVMKRILFPRRFPIDPQFTRIPYTQHSSLGVAIFANSITLTPGTVAIEVDDTHILVHALTGEAARDLARGEMDRRVTRLERCEG